MFSNSKKVDNCLDDEYEPFHSECTSKNEVEKYNESIFWNYENKVKDNEKDSPKYDSENANKVKKLIKLNVDEHQDAIQLLKEYFDIYGIKTPWKR